jgi:hypothetical protein
MAANERHLEVVTPAYVPVEPKFVSDEQLEHSSYEPTPGLITRIHEYAKERRQKRQRAIDHACGLQAKHFYVQNPGTVQKSPGGLWHNVGSVDHLDEAPDRPPYDPGA